MEKVQFLLESTTGQNGGQAKFHKVSSSEMYPFPFLVPNFRRHLSSAFVLNQLSIGKKFICKAEKLNVKQHRPR